MARESALDMNSCEKSDVEFLRWSDQKVRRYWILVLKSSKRPTRDINVRLLKQTDHMAPASFIRMYVEVREDGLP